jgi:hypothetical protein
LKSDLICVLLFGWLPLSLLQCTRRNWRLVRRKLARNQDETILRAFACVFCARDSAATRLH